MNTLKSNCMPVPSTPEIAVDVVPATRADVPQCLEGLGTIQAFNTVTVPSHGALLRLAQIDTGMRRSGFVAIDAGDLARQAVDFYLPAAELKGITLTYRGDCPDDIAGVPVLLAQAIGNLIDNALKYASERGSIGVEVAAVESGGVRITVADDGPGIPDDEKPKVPGRFYRGDASRGTPGVGLGLSLVASVAKVHGGALELADNHPGLRATMVITPGTGLAAKLRDDSTSAPVRHGTGMQSGYAGDEEPLRDATAPTAEQTAGALTAAMGAST